MCNLAKLFWGLLGGFAALAFISGVVVADDEPDGVWRAPPVGTLLQSNIGMSCRVIAVDDDRYHCEGDRSYWAQDRTWSVYKGLLEDVSAAGAKIRFGRQELDELFPLEVGRATTVRGRTANISWEMTFEVTSLKTIQTRLGPRSVFGVTYRETAENGYKAKGWYYLDAHLGFYHSGKRIEVSGGNTQHRLRLFTVELPAVGGQN